MALNEKDYGVARAVYGADQGLETVPLRGTTTERKMLELKNDLMQCAIHSLELQILKFVIWSIVWPEDNFLEGP